MKLLVRCLLAAGLIVAMAGGAVAQDPATTIVRDPAQPQAAWTQERMAAAEAMPFPTALATVGDTDMAQPIPPGPPTVVNGWVPGSAPYVERVTVLSPSEAQAMGQSPQTFGTAPTNPLSGPYGPFQRWTMEGQYPQGHRGKHGKLFFDCGGGTCVCSGTVIGRSTVATAAHCLHEGLGGGFYTDWSFCPSYYNGGPGGAGIPYPTRGCWGWDNGWVPNNWAINGDPDYDYACLVTEVTGTVVANKIGNVTGWTGRAWNFVDVPEIIFGYPHASPFTGQIITQVAAPDWYNWDPIAGGQVSKVVGNDMTGGSSGGGWFLGWAAPGAEIPDTDGNWGTDPTTAGPFINGVNSHKRCLVNCSSPPTATQGIFWQEMTSPPFRGGSDTDPQESEDIFALCLAHINNN